MSNSIPILNIYYLLCYAWDKLDEKDLVNVNKIDSNEIFDLFGSVLANGMTLLFKKGLDRGYLTYQEETGNIKGKINFSSTIKKNLLPYAKAECEYDDLSYNVLHNQVIKSTIRTLINYDDLDKEIKNELLLIYRKLYDVSDIKLEKKHFGQIQLNRNNIFYEFLLNICELITDNLLISEEDGKSKFRDFLQDEKKMNQLFESFVRNFYKRHTEYDVGKKDIPWNLVPLNQISSKYVPKMQTDITLKSDNRQLIIDTKYYKDALQRYYDSEKINSGNLYQLNAYLTNLEALGEENKSCEGMLLYPTVEDELNLSYNMNDHKISIRTINLNQDWTQIRYKLLLLVEKEQS